MIRVERLTGAALAAVLPGVARLRIEVFRAFPYLYDGDLAYEESYLQVYRESEDAILVGAWDGERLIGAATGTPMEDHAGDFGAAMAGCGVPLESIFYCAESVLLQGYRPLDAFWRKRGYAPVEGAVARFRWKDIDRDAGTEHDLHFWMRAL